MAVSQEDDSHDNDETAENVDDPSWSTNGLVFNHIKLFKNIGRFTVHVVWLIQFPFGGF